MRTTTCIKVLAAMLLLALSSCAASKEEKRSDEESVVPESFAPSKSKKSAPSPDGAAEEEAAPAEPAGAQPDAAPSQTICSTDNCKAVCGRYSGEELRRCFAAFKAGCFTSSPEEDYDCQGFGDAPSGDADGEAPESGEIREKEMPMNDI